MVLEFNSEALAASNPVTRSITTFTDLIHEGETAAYSVTLTGPGGAAIANTDFSAITLTYVDEVTFAVVNSRDEQDVLGSPANTGANNVTLSATADLVWSIQSADTVFVDPTQTRTIEYHRAIFTFTFDIGSGTEIGIHEVRVPIRRKFVAGNQTLS